jgi:hypothetical protein
MSKINFKGVEEARESQMTEPGTIDVFTIKEVKFDSTKNKGTYYMGVTFQRPTDSFNHSFFLSEKALPRVKSLVKHAANKELEDELSEEQLIKMLEGRELALKVIPKFDEENGRVYPDLAFGGFCKDAEDLSKLVFNEREKADIERARTIRRKANPADADAPTTKTAAPVAASVDEDIF